MSERRKVVVTGAAGLIAGHLLPFFHERYDLTLLDVRTTNRQGNEVEGLQIADLIDKDRDAYRGHFRGATLWCTLDSPETKLQLTRTSQRRWPMCRWLTTSTMSVSRKRSGALW